MTSQLLASPGGTFASRFETKLPPGPKWGGPPGNIRDRFSSKGSRVNPQRYERGRGAREQMEEHAEFLRRVIAGAYSVNAVYFFRNANYANTVFLDPLDITRACRPDYRRIAVLHLILQNGIILPDTLMTKLIKAIDDCNKSKQRDVQRPQCGTHLSEY